MFQLASDFFLHASCSLRQRRQQAPKALLYLVLVLALVLVLVAAGRPALAAPQAAPQETWYRVDIAGMPAGFMVNREIDDGENLISESELQLSFRRGGTIQDLGISSRFVESHAHEPLLMSSSQSLGAQPLEVSCRFEKDGVILMGPAGEQRRPRPEGDWLTPFAAQEKLEQEVKALLLAKAPGGGVRSFEIVALDPSLGLEPVTTRWVLEDPEVVVEIDGERRNASRWNQSQSFAPQVLTQVLLSTEGEMLESVTPMLGLDMRMVLSSEAKVRGFGEGSTAGPELLVQSFLYPDRPIKNPRRVRRAVYRLKVDGETPALPTVGYQRIVGDRVVVDLAAPSEALSSAELPNAQRYLQSSTYLRHDDPVLVTLHAAIVSDLPATASAAERAEALRRAVGRHLREKNLDTVLGTAVEAAESRAGDCTEHAVLLAALLRADGIPARVATGILYVESFAGKENLFAYHMWTQAWLEGAWRDLDATLGPETSFDAAHITLDLPDLDDEGAALMHMAGVAPLIGRASIEVLETSTEGLQ